MNPMPPWEEKAADSRLYAAPSLERVEASFSMVIENMRQRPARECTHLISAHTGTGRWLSTTNWHPIS